ncbi:urease accessory protein UreD [Streptomyces sp. 6N106]|uniref:urease accessory protein UreD n=1 Tax=Streptomyces sp. 6N106 TaxID=3457418 RepID=UPI003FD4CE91
MTPAPDAAARAEPPWAGGPAASGEARPHPTPRTSGRGSGSSDTGPTPGTPRTPGTPHTPATAVQATARILAEVDGRGGTALPVLVGDGPLALRRTRAVSGEARVTVVGAMSAPLGGDRIALEATAGPGARLRIGSAAATVALPGRTGRPAHYEIRLTVADGATLHWLPEPLISAQGSDLRMTTRVELAPTARLVLREEQILGRTGESPGHLTARLTVHRAGRPLLDQEISYGPGPGPGPGPGAGALGWDGGSVLGGHRAVGQLLVVDPSYATSPLATRALTGTAVLTPLTGPAALATAVAPDAIQLRRALDEAAAAVG